MKRYLFWLVVVAAFGATTAMAESCNQKLSNNIWAFEVDRHTFVLLGTAGGMYDYSPSQGELIVSYSSPRPVEFRMSPKKGNCLEPWVVASIYREITEALEKGKKIFLCVDGNLQVILGVTNFEGFCHRPGNRPN